MYELPKATDPSGIDKTTFPDGVARLKLTGYEAQRFADLALHMKDLTLAGASLSRLRATSMDDTVLRQALWISAVVSFFKCFGGGVRAALDANTIYTDVGSALQMFTQFKAVRDKETVHDANAVTNSVPAAILNSEKNPIKIAGVTATTVMVGINLADLMTLEALIGCAMDWVRGEFNTVRSAIMARLEAIPYEELAAYEKTAALPDTAFRTDMLRGRRSTNSMKTKG